MSTPYYQDNLVTLYLGDCRNIDSWLGADVLVTDPPYGMAYRSNSSKYNGPTDAIAGDDDPTLRDDVLRAWGSQRPALAFGHWRIPRPTGTKQVVVWDKGDSPGMGDLRIPWGPGHEEIYVLGEWPVRNGGPKRSASVVRSRTLGAADAERPDHPTPKPVGLMELLVLRTTGVVADPFAGSGATLLACRNLGRRVIGVELEEKYCELIASRLSQGVLDFGESA